MSKDHEPLNGKEIQAKAALLGVPLTCLSCDFLQNRYIKPKGKGPLQSAAIGLWCHQAQWKLDSRDNGHTAWDKLQTARSCEFFRMVSEGYSANAAYQRSRL